MRRYMKMNIQTAGRALPWDITRQYLSNQRIALPLRSARAFIKKCPFGVEEEGIIDIVDGIDENYSFYDSIEQYFEDYEEMREG